MIRKLGSRSERSMDHSGFKAPCSICSKHRMPLLSLLVGVQLPVSKRCIPVHLKRRVRWRSVWILFRHCVPVHCSDPLFFYYPDNHPRYTTLGYSVTYRSWFPDYFFNLAKFVSRSCSSSYQGHYILVVGFNRHKQLLPYFTSEFVYIPYWLCCGQAFIVSGSRLCFFVKIFIVTDPDTDSNGLADPDTGRPKLSP